MGTRRFRRSCVSVVIALALTGCTTGPSEPSPSPTVTPTTLPTPPETELQRERRLDFEAAEKAYRTFRIERERLLIAGGAQQASAVMKANAAGPYLKQATKLLNDYRLTGSRQVGKEVIGYVRSDAYSEDSLLLNACQDGRRLKVYLGKKSLGAADVRAVQLEVRRIDGRWKVWSSTGRKVATCD